MLNETIGGTGGDGGLGGDGGAGGLAVGGAIYLVADAVFTSTGDVFDRNTVVGGDGR